jgi:hypothetical protein
MRHTSNILTKALCGGFIFALVAVGPLKGNDAPAQPETPSATMTILTAADSLQGSTEGSTVAAVAAQVTKTKWEYGCMVVNFSYRF